MASTSWEDDDVRGLVLEAEQKIVLSHSGAQKAFVERLCLELERCYRFPFFDKRHSSLPIGEHFPQRIFGAIRQCKVGVVILSEEFLTSKWPMMELVAMVGEAEKRTATFKIMPIFLNVSLEEFDDPKNRIRWLSRWQELAVKDSQRVDIEKWKFALQYLRSINGLLFKDGLEELKFQRMIADAICEVVPSEIRMDDSHIEGRLRLSKVIQDKINVLQKNKVHGACIVGLYGMVGIGKTSICKVLCNSFFTKFCGRVCHAELEKGSEVDMLREILKKLTNTSSEVLDGLKIYELRNSLKEGMIKEPVFLTFDNMADTFTSINEAKSYLSAKFPPGSIVMVTSRSKDSLMKTRYIDEDNCMEMPELEKEEAKALFVKSSNFTSRNATDDQLIERCTKRCYFLKDSGSKSYHYHPLALHVLGCQLGFIDPTKWGAQLDKIDDDIFNASRENDHPIFSILRTSFDTLTREDQLLFMDVGLFLPAKDGWMDDKHFLPAQDRGGWNMFKWLGIVHKIPSEDDVIRGLQRLKAKSLLESVGDGVETSIGMHDLWRAFCVAETKSGEFRRRRWIYEAEHCSSELVETGPSGACWENVMRMAFVDTVAMSRLERVNFPHFSNITVLKLVGLHMSEKLAVNLSGLVHLKSLEVSGSNLHFLFIQSLPRSLLFLRSSGGFTSTDEVAEGSSHQFVDEIGCLKELQCLQLIKYLGSKLPDMRNMASMRVAIFYYCENVVTLAGLSSALTRLRVLILQGCEQLQSCPGVEDLVLLEVLDCQGCRELKGLPNLRKLRRLRKLNIISCELIPELHGLDGLVALEEFHATACDMSKLPDMSKSRHLRVLKIGSSLSWTAIRGIEGLTSLKELEVGFRRVVERPNLRRLTKLQKLFIDGCGLEELRELHNLTLLEILKISCCGVVDDLPDLRSLICLQKLRIVSSGFKDVSGLMNLRSLESLVLNGCDKLERLPDMHSLTRLKSLEIMNCDMLEGWDFTLEHTRRHVDPTSRSLSQLQTLHCESNFRLWELPDLSSFPRLETLRVNNCRRLRKLSSREPLNALSELVLRKCDILATVPDLSHFPRLLMLEVRECDWMTSLSSSQSLAALTELHVDTCNGLQTLPDLGMFPALKMLELKGCSKLTTLSSSAPLPALEVFRVVGCRNLSQEAFDQLRAFICPECHVHYFEKDSDGGVSWDSNDAETDSDEEEEEEEEDLQMITKRPRPSSHFDPIHDSN